MSSADIIQEAYTLLQLMKKSAGYSRDYTPVKSVYNASATMKQTPYISVHTEQEEPYDGPTGFNEVRSVLPLVVTARVKPMHKFRSEIEHAEDIVRGEVIRDMKSMFRPATARVFSDCISIQVGEEIDPESNGLSDSNKHDMFVQYRFYVTYKENLI